ncbi:MAG: bifunctional precorrin-2 dehydrogenase/sirohydrochlorin ferrochelatase [Thermodesulfobacteriota bacterium]
MRYYPVFLDLQGVSCLVVGGGQVGERKVKTLLSCGARVFLISRDLTPFLKEELGHGRVTLLKGDYDPSCLENIFLVIGATDDTDLNQRIGREARHLGLLCNIVDKPAECNFILPSLVSRGDLTVAVSTAGKSPALARKIREELEEIFPEIYGIYLDLLGKIRQEVLALSLPQSQNQEIFKALVKAPVLSWMRNGDAKAMEDFLDRVLGPLCSKIQTAGLIRPFFPSPR